MILPGRPVRGRPAANDEASDVGWFTAGERDSLDIHPPRSPEANAYAGRWVRTVRSEVTDRRLCP